MLNVRRIQPNPVAQPLYSNITHLKIIHHSPFYYIYQRSLSTLVSSKTSEESRKSTSSSTTGLLALALCRITSLGTEDILGVGSSIAVDHLAAVDTTVGRDVVVCLCGGVLVLGNGSSIGRVDNHDHALLAVLGLGAVDVDGLVVGNGDHEHGVVASLAATVGGVGATLGVTWDGLEVGEEGVGSGLAGLVCCRGGHTVVL